MCEKLPLFLLASASSLATFFAQENSGAVMALDKSSLSTRRLNAVVSYGTDAGQRVRPENLAVLYPFHLKAPIGQAVSAGVLLLFGNVYGLAHFSMFYAENRKFTSFALR